MEMLKMLRNYLIVYKVVVCFFKPQQI